MLVVLMGGKEEMSQIYSEGEKIHVARVVAERAIIINITRHSTL